MKRRLLATLLAVCMIFTLVPAALAAGNTASVSMDFTCSAAAWELTEKPTEDSTIEWDDTESFESEDIYYSTVAEALSDLAAGRVVVEEGSGGTASYSVYKIDLQEPVTITLHGGSDAAAVNETISKKVVLSSPSDAALDGAGESDTLNISAANITISANSHNLRCSHTITFEGGLEVQSGASLVLLNDSNGVGNGHSTINYIFSDAVTIGGSLTFDGNQQGGEIEGPVTFSDSASMTVENGGEVTIKRVAVTGTTTEPLITVASGGILNVSAHDQNDYAGSIQAAGTAIKNSGGTLNLDSGTISTTSSDQPVILSEGGAVKLEKTQKGMNTATPSAIPVINLTAPTNAPAIRVKDGGSLTIETGNVTSSSAEQPAIVVESGEVKISKDADTDLTPTITAGESEGGQAVDLRAGVSVTNSAGVTATVSQENGAAGQNYVDNAGNIVLAAGATVKDKDGTEQTLTSGGAVDTEGNLIVAVASVSLDRNALTLNPGGTAQLAATVTPNNATETVVWTSSNEAVATVDQSGNVTAVGVGTATITVTTGGKTATCTVTVSYPYVPVAPTQPTKPAEPDQPEEPDTPFIPGALPFVDVNTGDWFYEDVAYVYAQGIMTGSTATSFAPNDAMTRAMVWTVLGRMSGEDVEGGTPWYALAQAWAVSDGVSDGTAPNDSITREQLVTMLYRQAGSPEVGVSELALLGRFTDGEAVSDWAEEAMAWAVSQGILTGDGDLLRPQAAATRAQVAAILARYCEADKK